ncbi:MAG: SdrD B-like domain-containing protein, partial [Pseudomonadota bacterium]
MKGLLGFRAERVRDESGLCCGRANRKKSLAKSRLWRMIPHPGALCKLLLVSTALVAGVFISPIVKAQEVTDTFYLPLPEDQLLTTLLEVNPGSCPGAPPAPQNPIFAYTSLVVLRDGTQLVYDHWEDNGTGGYETDPFSPTQAETEIWGDGNPANGLPPLPGCGGDDICDAGDVIVLEESGILTTNLAVVDFDGRDKVSTTDVISMTKANWATGSSTLFAGALEMYPTSVWGTGFDIPVGENVQTDGNDPFEHVGLSIMAAVDDTTIWVDIDADGVQDAGEVTTDVDEGETVFVNGLVQLGATIQATPDAASSDTSDRLIQVAVLSGDNCANYESRFFTIFPTDEWSNAYYNPVATTATGGGIADPTVVSLFNPTNSTINVLVITDGDAPPTNPIVLDPGAALPGYGEFTMTDEFGARFCTTSDNANCDPNGENFYAIASVARGGAGNAHDWGFTLVPEGQLTQQVLVGLGLGRDPDAADPPEPPGEDENSSPVWVTPARLDGGSPVGGTLGICVDWDNDGTDPGNTFGGTFTFPGGGGTTLMREYDERRLVDELSSNIFYDGVLGDGTVVDATEVDQTGMFVFICDDDLADQQASGVAVAWGQDSDTASGGFPGLDVGTGVPNVESVALIKRGEVTSDVNGDGLPNAGDTIEYTVEIENTGFLPVDTVTITDPLNPNTTYIPDSTTGQLNPDGMPPGNINAIPDDVLVGGNTTLFPYDENGGPLPTILNVGDTIALVYEVTVDDPLPFSLEEICNTATVETDTQEAEDEECLPISPNQAVLGDFVFEDTNGNGLQDTGEPGLAGLDVYICEEPVMFCDSTNDLDVYATVTGANGSYLFVDLPAGNYQVGFELAADSQLTLANVGSNGVIDSDATLLVPTDTIGQTGTITLGANETNLDIDAGMVGIVEVSKSVNSSNNPVLNPDGTFTVTYQVTAEHVSGLNANYDLVDILDPATGITVIGNPTVTFDLSNTSPTTGNALGVNGNTFTPGDPEAFTPSDTGTTLVTSELIAPGETETWTVTVVFDVNRDTVNVTDLICDVGDGIAGGGGLNNLIETNDAEDDETNDEACVGAPLIEVSKTAVGPALDNGNDQFEVTY